MAAPDADQLLAIYLDDHRAGAAGGSALVHRLVDRYGDDPGYEPLRELARQIDEDVATLDRLRDELDVHGGDLKRLVALAGERLGRLKLNGRLASKSPLSRVEELEGMAAGVFAKRQLWSAIGACAAPVDIDVAQLIDRAEGQLQILADLHVRAVDDAFMRAGASSARQGDVDTRQGDSSRERFTDGDGG
jgi:hypothetical protein